MVGFVAFLLFLGLGFDFAYLRDSDALPVPVGTTIALLYGGGTSLYSYFKGDRAVLRSTAAVPIGQALANATTEEQKLRIRQFQNVVEEMSIAAGLPLPHAYLIPDP